jgi:hypothetical protein
MRKFTPLSIWLILIAAPIPFFLILFQCIFGLQKLEQLEEEMQRIHTKMIMQQENQKKESYLLAALKNPDPHYLDKHVESLTFLLPEIKKLETVQLENADDDQIGKRLQWIKEGGNRLRFSEEHIQNNALFRETEEQQQLPIELNEEDLKKLLCLIEGITIWPYGPKEGRPQLILKEFKLTKKELAPHEKVFVVSMQLIKRENLEAIQ